MVRVLSALALALAAATASAAEPPSLALPVDCVIGEDCWVAQYMDMDASRKVRDFACGPMSYDGHKGTDFAVRDLKAMHDGVPVVAAAAGEVAGVRDGLPDVNIRDLRDRKTIQGRECGNGVVLRHGGGWETQYCHLRLDSVAVRSGDRVAAGQTLGFIGMSGAAEFPHVQFSVRRDGNPVDPFAGVDRQAPCGVGEAPLWNAEALAVLAYDGAALYNAGFAPWPPEREALADGAFAGSVLPADAPAFVFWLEMYGARAGDTLTLTVTAPDGATFVRSEKTVEKTQIRRFDFAGRKRTAKAWPRGTYQGEAVLTRKDGGAETRLAIRRSVEVR